jgi:WD repeat-containing protein 19
VDDAHQGYIYNPVNDQTLKLPEFSATTTHVMWDAADAGVIVTCDRAQFNTYIYQPAGLNGATVSLVASSPLPSGHTPITVYNGHVTCQGSSGQLDHVNLSTHEALLLRDQQPGNREQAPSVLAQNMKLGRLKECWEVAAQINTADTWQRLATAAMEVLDIELALRVYRQLGDAAMVLGLEKVLHIEDSKLLAGHVALLFGDYTTAQDFFLASSRPLTALEMRRDLLHWDQALKLARTLAPEQIPYISRAYAQQLEFKGEYSLALQMYEKGVIDTHSRTAGGEQQQPFGTLAPAEHNALAKGGIARMTLRLGDVPRGISMVVGSENQQLQKDCAAILEGMRQWQDAGMLYERAGALDKAAEIYIQTKNFAQAAPLMASITSPKLHLQFGAAKEAEGAFLDAAAAFEKARDMDAVVRLNLDQLRNPSRAMQIVRETRSTEGASKVAEYCKRTGNTHAAIEFLLLAKQNTEAFEQATANDAVDTFASSLGDDGTPDEYTARLYQSSTSMIIPMDSVRF